MNKSSLNKILRLVGYTLRLKTSDDRLVLVDGNSQKGIRIGTFDEFASRSAVEPYVEQILGTLVDEGCRMKFRSYESADLSIEDWNIHLDLHHVTLPWNRSRTFYYFAVTCVQNTSK